VPPGTLDNTAATAAVCIGVAAGLLGGWLSGSGPTHPAASASA